MTVCRGLLQEFSFGWFTSAGFLSQEEVGEALRRLSRGAHADLASSSLSSSPLSSSSSSRTARGGGDEEETTATAAVAAAPFDGEWAAALAGLSAYM